MSRDEVDALKANDLIGTKFLQSYMHGFIMKAKLFNKLKEKNQVFDYQAYKEEQIKTRLDKEVKKDKIVNKNVKVKANEKMIENLAKSTIAGKDTATTRARQALLIDDRFQGLTQDTDFERDETNEDYLLRNPTAANKLKKKSNNNK